MNGIIKSDKKATMSSREIATLTGKRHDQVMRDIRNMLEQLKVGAHTYEDTYLSEQNKELPCFKLDRIHVECLLTGYSIPLRMKVLERLTELEQTNTPQLPNFSNPAEAARAWADEVEAKQAAVALIEQQKPAVEFVERYTQAKGNKTFREVAKILNIKENVFRDFLTRKAIMYKLNGSWTPKQCHIDCGRFMVITGLSNGIAFNHSLFTPKGINWIAGEIAKDSIQDLL